MQACPWLLLVLPLFACAKASPIEARGGFHPVAYPPGVQSGIKAIIDGGRAFEPEGICFEQTFDAQKKERLTPRDFSHARGRLISLERELAEPMAYQSFGHVEVKNVGAQPLNSVALEGPFVGEFSVLINGATELGRFEQKIPVGNLPAGGTATVRFWTGSAPGAVDVSQETRITFAGGAAAIIYENQTRGAWHWMSRRLSAWLAFNIGISLVIAAGVIVLLIRRRRADRG
ncbi:MAG TPA: hypothetical protein VGG33_29260 [Polyangia bacterium]